ncbi:hypothetical protein HMPREF9460_04022 [Flavonifractor plautii 1_3_50AFAA]|uniref:Transporter n=1 Tax=Flavonifractor plautii 1_3_50AFAA TaxID=742738 RepID=A0A096D4M7_FLAPL|nr:hypothetical protein HMPREF9460_04022 [Flavonifractor plautii 1_3_50AFAA]
MHKSGSDGKFTSSIGFVLAAVGSAVGMANIWLFPYRVGQYGGGAFLIPYFLFVALFSYVGLSGEFALGRLTGTGAMGSLDYVLRQRGRRGGRVLGAIPLLGVLGIAIGYSVVVGWVLRYAAGSLTGSVLAGDAQGFFSALAVDFGSIPWHFAAVAVTAAILIFGVASGIEKLSKVMMPAFFILFLIIAVRVAFLPGAMEGYLYLLRPDWSYLLNPETWVMAMGQAFFSLSINGAGMLIYGSYMKKGENILRHAGMTAVLDTLAALLAGFAILPAVFAFGIDPTSGPQLMFVTLPHDLPADARRAHLRPALLRLRVLCGHHLPDEHAGGLRRGPHLHLPPVPHRFHPPGGRGRLPPRPVPGVPGGHGGLDGFDHHLRLSLRRAAGGGVHLLCAGHEGHPGRAGPGPGPGPRPPFRHHRPVLCVPHRGGMDSGHRLRRHRLNSPAKSGLRACAGRFLSPFQPTLELLQQLHGLELHHVALVLPGHQGDLVLRQPGLQGGLLRGLADGAQA